MDHVKNNPEALSELGFGTKLNIFIRSMFIQSGWNYKGMISMGFSFALTPIARLYYGDDPKAYNHFLRRHMGFFNAHPYFASFALGAIARLEWDIKDGKVSVEKEEHFKNVLIGPLGAIGDQLFWSIIRPATFVLGVLGFYFAKNVHQHLTILLSLFILYNIPHLYIRFQGFWRSYKDGYNVCRILKMEHFKYLKWLYMGIGLVSVGILTGFIAPLPPHSLELLIFILSILVAAYLKSQKGRTYLAMTIPLALALTLELISGSL
ncbi:MAG: hypothetical protein D6677_07985 [Calditrichaeota bacterium]|nr:MAG: hypothetical protein D6677_07985 [Calditrichota bacterium]